MLFKKSLLVMTITAVTTGAIMASSISLAQSSSAVQVQTISEPAVRGQVADHRGLFVQGAIVRLEGTNRDVVTNRQGSFRFDNLQPGEYQLSVSYLGFEAVSTTVVVRADQGQLLDIDLQPTSSAQTAENVVVVGVRDGQARALNMQRSADNIKSVVSSDYLGRFPDYNVAESTQRLVGVSIQRDQGEGRYVNVRGAPVEFANVSIDGVILPSPDAGTRAIDLDTLPADVISALELTKAITPDMDADAIAGNINIITQGALDAKDRILRMNASGGYNEKGSGSAYRTGLTWGDRIAGRDDLGFLISVNHNETNRVTDNVEHTWFDRGDGVFLVQETEFKDYEVKRSRSGANARLDFKPGDNTHLFLSHNFARFEDDEFRDTITIGWDRFTPESNSTTGVAGRATFDNELRHRRVVNTINTTQAAGTTFFNEIEVKYSAAYSQSTQKYPDRDYLIYRESSRPPVAYDFSNPDLPMYRVLDGEGNTLRSDFNFPVDSYDFRRYERRFGDSQETEQAYALSAKFPTKMGEADATFQVGAKARLKDKENDEFRFRNSEGVGAPEFSEILIGKQSRPFSGTYNNGPKFVRDFVGRYGNTLESQDYNLRVAASVTSDYEASEDIYAAFAMGTFEWQKTTILVGLRAEQTRTSGLANEFDDDLEIASPVSASNSYTKLFPSAHLRYEMDNGVILRAAFSTALSRPNFEDLVPYFIIEDRASGFGTIDIGNTNLNPTYARNFDLMAEYYIEPLGLISAGLFYKDLDDPIFKSQSFVEGGEFDRFVLVRPENGSNGSIRGLELNWQQSLDFLPGAWAGMGFIANYTFSDSSAELPFDVGRTTLAGTSRHTYNLALQYDSTRFTSQLSYNYRSEFIDSFNTSDPGLNVYWDERATLDMMATYKLSEQVTAFLEAINLTDTKAIRFQGERSRVYEHELFGRSVQLGLRARF